jgi:hypothetical protein
VNYGFTPDMPGYKRDREPLLEAKLVALCKEYGGGSEHEAKWSGNPYVEVNRLYEGVRIRKITHLSETDTRKLVERADAIFVEVMELKPQ